MFTEYLLHEKHESSSDRTPLQEFYNLLIRIQPNVEEEVLSIDDASNTEEEVVNFN